MTYRPSHLARKKVILKEAEALRRQGEEVIIIYTFYSVPTKTPNYESMTP